MITKEDEYKLEKWFIDFQKDYGNKITNDFIYNLGARLCDDCPMGYEASHRLAQWLFIYRNQGRTERF